MEEDQCHILWQTSLFQETAWPYPVPGRLVPCQVRRIEPDIVNQPEPVIVNRERKTLLLEENRFLDQGHMSTSFFYFRSMGEVSRMTGRKAK